MVSAISPSIGMTLSIAAQSAITLVQTVRVVALPVFTMMALSSIPVAEAKDNKSANKYCHDLCHEVHHGFLRSTCIALCIAGKFAFDQVVKRILK